MEYQTKFVTKDGASPGVGKLELTLMLMFSFSLNVDSIGKNSKVYRSVMVMWAMMLHQNLGAGAGANGKEKGHLGSHLSERDGGVEGDSPRVDPKSQEL